MRVGGRAAGGYRAVAGYLAAEGYDATAGGIVNIMSLPAIRWGHSAARLLQHTTCAARCLLARIRREWTDGRSGTRLQWVAWAVWNCCCFSIEVRASLLPAHTHADALHCE